MVEVTNDVAVPGLEARHRCSCTCLGQAVSRQDERVNSPGGRGGEGLDAESPNAARMYDYYLGGAANFEVDRVLADQVVAMRPELPAIARANRAYLRRVVRFAVAAGVRQYLDLGSGVPTVGNVHEAALAADPRCRVVYVDHEPVAATYAAAFIAHQPQVEILQIDLRDHEQVLERAAAAGLIDLREPVAVLAVAVLHFLPDAARPAEIALLGASDRATGPQRLRNGALLRLLLHNALRVDELLNADLVDLARFPGQAIVHDTLEVVRKGGRRTRVALAPTTIASLERYLVDRAERCGVDRRELHGPRDRDQLWPTARSQDSVGARPAHRPSRRSGAVAKAVPALAAARRPHAGTRRGRSPARRAGLRRTPRRTDHPPL